VVESARKYRYANAATCAKGVSMVLTHHAITFSKTTTVSGSNDGTVNLSLCRSDNEEVMVETSRAGNGTVAWTWYDDALDMFIEAYEADGYSGRSDDFKFSD